MTNHVVESISELSAMMKVGAMTGSEKDAGFCSGGDEDDISNLHSPSASEDSLEVQVMPISLKNKRKLAEPRKIQEGNSAPLKKRKYEHVEEQRVPDEEPTRTVRSPNPFRPWSCTNKNVADSKVITEKNTSQSCVSMSEESAAATLTASRVNHRYYHYHHRHHNYYHHHHLTSGGDNRKDIPNNDDDNKERDQHRALNLNSENAADTLEKQREGEETSTGRQRQDKTRTARTETDFAAASTKITTPETTLSSSVAASPHPRLQEEPLSLVLRGDVAARVPSHPAVNGSYEKSYPAERANVSSASSSISSSSSCSSSSSSSCSPSPSFSSLSSRQQNHRTRSNGENSCSTTRTTTVSITSTITTPTTTVTGIQSGQPTRQYSAAGQQRNYKNMTRERRIEANARERTRVHTISAAFDTLRRAIPAYSHNQKLSKLSVLRIACSYIMTLGKIVNTPEGEPVNGASLGTCVDLVSRTIQTEGKLRKRKED